MTRYVPIVAVVPLDVATRLAAVAASQPVRPPEIDALLARTGWTTEMLVAGAALAEGLAAASARPFG